MGADDACRVYHRYGCGLVKVDRHEEIAAAAQLRPPIAFVRQRRITPDDMFETQRYTVDKSVRRDGPAHIRTLLEAESPEAYNPDTLTVGVARLGWNDQTIKADTAGGLTDHDFGDPPHALIIPGRLHFLEAEALGTIGGCPPEALEHHRPASTIDTLIEKYTTSCRKAMDKLETREPTKAITPDEVKALIQHAERYLNDADHYAEERKATALASVSYAEGILDALRLLGLVQFEW